MRVDNQTAHFQQRIVEAVVVEHATGVFQHAQFGITFGCFGGKVAAAMLQIVFGYEGLLCFVKRQGVLLDGLHLLDLCQLRRTGGLHGFNVDFAGHGVLIELHIGGQHVALFHAVQVGIEVVQAVDFRLESALLRLIQQVTATRSLLVGVGVNNQNIAIRILASEFQSCGHQGITALLCLIHCLARPAVHAVFVGHE